MKGSHVSMRYPLEQSAVLLVVELIGVVGKLVASCHIPKRQRFRRILLVVKIGIDAQIEVDCAVKIEGDPVARVGHKHLETLEGY